MGSLTALYGAVPCTIASVGRPTKIQFHLNAPCSNTKTMQNLKTSRRNMSVHCNNGGLPIPPLPGLPSNPGPGSWKLWLVGVAVALVVPFWRKQLWSNVKGYAERFDEIVNTVEKVADIVEDVAEQVEKVADGVGNNLPAGKLKDAFQLIEDFADQTEKSAELAGDVIDKVQELEEQLDAYIEATDDDDEHAKVAKELKRKINEEVKPRINDQLAAGGGNKAEDQVAVAAVVEETKSRS
ncbi:unnamed protein product [Linum trigynum]